MRTPEREPRAVLDKTQCLSGPAPASAAFRRSCDQAVSPRWLAPSWAAQQPVTLGYGLEILTILWGATRARGSSFGSKALILMGGRHGDNLSPNVREPGHTEA